MYVKRNSPVLSVFRVINSWPVMTAELLLSYEYHCLSITCFTCERGQNQYAAYRILHAQLHLNI